jgi:hypothetical protein
MVGSNRGLMARTKPAHDYKVEEDEVGGTCGTNGREEERV